jgi:hypothetical protein
MQVAIKNGSRHEVDRAPTMSSLSFGNRIFPLGEELLFVLYGGPLWVNHEGRG